VSRRGDLLRLALIGSTVISAALVIVLGIPRLRAFVTPRIERVRVVSAALGDSVASVGPREVLDGTPVTLYAVIEARSWRGRTEWYGSIDSVRLAPDAEPVVLQAWSDWWLAPEFLWFKVQPTVPVANDGFDADFRPEQIAFSDAYQVGWGFGGSHAADIRAAGDAYPELTTGTMRFAARAVVRDHRDRILQQVTSPAAAEVDAPIVEERPHRVTVRGGDDAFGYLVGFAGLPYVPTVGEVDPAEHPTPLYLGGTILDFWMQARHLAGLSPYGPRPWERLADLADVVVDDMFIGRDGNYYWSSDPRLVVRWDLLRPGDLVTIDDHVGVLVEDRGPGGAGDGILNRWDRAWEAYFEPLRETALGDAFVADITIYRLRDEGDGR